ncbi:MAG: RDD family protein, partial [Acidobacteria bacterium]
ALIVDALLIGLLIIALVVIAIILGVGSIATAGSMTAGSWVLAFAIFAYFVLMWGYFLIFEALNNGQTPGKRWTRIQVVRDDGLPVRWRESALRNLVRAADILPPPACIVGGLAILLSKSGKRLGDLLAGTIVV